MSIPIPWRRKSRVMAHSVAERQLTPIFTGGSKYQAMALGPSHEKSRAPKKAPKQDTRTNRVHFIIAN